MGIFGNITMYDILVQGAGIIGIIASILSFQCKSHKPLTLLRTANEMFFAVQYFFLGAYTGVAMNLIGSLRNFVFIKMVEQNKSTKKMCFVFSALFLVFVAFTWEGPKSIIIGIAKVVSTFAYGNRQTAYIRILILLTSLSWFFYNLLVKSYAGCICEALTGISIIAGIIRIDILGKMRKA